jgi:glyoxylase-like metal-dependent hydrolase (beta-lactamase superfamily II)
MPPDEDAVTPHPPATPEFGLVERGGPAHRYPRAGDLQVTKVCVGEWDNNVYVLAADGEALIVDGAAEPDRILAEAEGLRVLGIVETHGHGDHVGALRALVKELDVRVLAHPGDPMPVPTEPLAGGETLSVGSVDVQVLHTPGHTPGSLCFLANGLLFSGDTLFPGGPGNTRNDKAAFTTIMRSLDTLFRLPDDTRVCPGHGLDTSIGRERPYVEVWRGRGW